MELRPKFEEIEPAPASADGENDDPLISAEPNLLWRLYRRDGRPVLEKYALAMLRRFPRDAPLDRCAVFPSLPASRMLAARWRGTLPTGFNAGSAALTVVMLLVGHLHISGDRNYFDFYTFHGFSGPGLWYLRLKRMLAPPLQILLGILATGLVIAGLVFAVVAFKEPRDPDAGKMLMDSAACWAGLVVAAFCFHWSHRLEAPASLRFVGRRPFRLYQLGAPPKPLRRKG